MEQPEFDKVQCPFCKRTITHYIKGSGTDSIYRNPCPRCGKLVLIYSAGKTMLCNTEFKIEIEIKF
jgi:phage FluMu protein Com